MCNALRPVGPPSPSGFRLSFNRSVSVGHVLQASLLGVGLVAWFLSGSAKVDRTADDLESLRGLVAAQATTFREESRAGAGRIDAALAELRESVGSLPEVAARVRALEDAVRRQDERADAIDGRLEAARTAIDARLERMTARGFELLRDRGRASR